MVSSLSHRPPLWYLIKFTIVVLIIASIYVFSNAKSQHGAKLAFDEPPRWTDTRVLKTRKTRRRDDSMRLPNVNLWQWSIGRKLFSLESAVEQQQLTSSFALSNSTFSSLMDHANMMVYAANVPPIGDDDDEDEDDGNTAICHRLPLYPYDKCVYAKDNCMNPLAGGILNYLQIRYCTFTWAPIFYILMGVWLFVLFFLLGDTAEGYFCPSLTEISRLLRLSPDVSGVTFLAFGNGAPDIASIIAGVVGGSAGFGLGEPIGAGLFVTTTVFAVVALISPVKVDAVPFIRDVGTCLVGVTFCFIVFLTGKFELWQSLMCLGLYALYVTFVVVGKQAYYLLRRLRFLLRQNASKLDERESLLGAADRKTYGDSNGVHKGRWEQDMAPIWDQPVSRAAHLDTDFVEDHRGSHPFYASHYYPKIGIAFKTSADSKLEVAHVDAIARAAKHSINDIEDGPSVVETHISDSDKDGIDLVNANDDDLDAFYDDSAEDAAKKRRVGTVIIEDHFSPHERIPNDDELHINENIVMRLYYELRDWIDWEEMSTMDRIQFILASPFTLIRNLTIPRADKEEWSKLFAVLCPIFIPWFVLWVVGYSTYMIADVVPLGAVLTVFGALCGFVILITSQRGKAPVYHPVLVILSFFMGIIWIYILANELVDVLQSIGILWQVSDAILAVTVLTWGNSLGDMVADVVVARSGFPDMACAAIFGGPTLNLLIGVGLSVSYHCITEGHSFALEQEPTVFLSFVMLIMSLVGSLIVIPLSGFKAPKHYGIMLLLMYASFMMVAVCMELGLLWPKI